MSDEVRELEHRLMCAMPRSAPASLRPATLAQVQRELRRARWDRRLGRLAAAIFVVGVGLNAGLTLQGDARLVNGINSPMAAKSRAALAETAAIVADAADAETARRFVRQMAALGRLDLSDE
jgi:hypothetical protein